jgi:Flp pilus assembly CpaE family ATPase
VELPYDPFLYLKAVNEGVPVVAGAPRSNPAVQLTKLATVVTGTDRPPMPETVEPARRGRLRLLRRS